jgi:hypothetical protein
MAITGPAITLANCTKAQLEDVRKRGLHPTVKRHELIFAAGALNNEALRKDLGSMELCTFYDGMLAAGLIDENPYWPRHKGKS